jgi:HAD superfamily hydrolase (TIGR01549 family)
MEGNYFFDAVGTVIELRSKVERVYATVGQRWGNQQSPDTVGARWRSAFAKHFGSSTLAYSQPIDEEGECQRWQKIVQETFAAAYSPGLFEELWTYFARPENWRVLPDAKELIERLDQAGLPVGIASNFDQRLVGIITALLPGISTDRICYSSRIGFLKPDVRFYKKIESNFADESTRKFVMIGDHFANDVESPRRAGWWSYSRYDIGTLLDRFPRQPTD